MYVDYLILSYFCRAIENSDPPPPSESEKHYKKNNDTQGSARAVSTKITFLYPPTLEGPAICACGTDNLHCELLRLMIYWLNLKSVPWQLLTKTFAHTTFSHQILVSIRRMRKYPSTTKIAKDWMMVCTLWEIVRSLFNVWEGRHTSWDVQRVCSSIRRSERVIGIYNMSIVKCRRCKFLICVRRISK